MNPQHTIPTMKDGDFIMNESRPAATYLISKYGKDDKLYPKDVACRAISKSYESFDHKRAHLKYHSQIVQYSCGR